jgi:Sulfotransferase family
MTRLQRPAIASQTVVGNFALKMATSQRLLDTSGSVVAFSPPDSRPPEGGRQLDRAARLLAPLGAPVIVFNASHSGSRLLAIMLRRLGVFMGSHLNDSEDSLDLFELVKYLVERHAPDYSRLFAEGDPALAPQVQAAIAAHLQDRPPGQAWGWKLCETGHALPVISRLFPTARCIHLIRDGRDVAFSPFVAPKALFWRKIYFNDDRISSWRGHGMTQRAYRKHGHLFNAARWVNSVSLGRAYGAMLGERYLEVRYEDLVADPAGQMRRVADFLGLAVPSLECADVSSQSVGKWRNRPRREIAEVMTVLEPALSAFGYGQTEMSAPKRVLGAIGRLLKRRN